MPLGRASRAIANVAVPPFVGVDVGDAMFRAEVQALRTRAVAARSAHSRPLEARVWRYERTLVIMDLSSSLRAVGKAWTSFLEVGK